MAGRGEPPDFGYRQRRGAFAQLAVPLGEAHAGLVPGGESDLARHELACWPAVLDVLAVGERRDALFPEGIQSTPGRALAVKDDDEARPQRIGRQFFFARLAGDGAPQ